MTVGPRIVFLRFATSTSPKLRPWREHLRRVTGAAPEIVGLDDESASVIVWNLVSGNNRELGRGAKIFQRFDDAVLSVQRLIPENLEFAPVSGDRDGVYGWRASFGGQTEVACSRWYQTDRDRQHAILIAAAALRVASLGAGARFNHPALMAGERSAFDD